MGQARTLLHLTDLHFGGSGHYWDRESPELELPEHDRRGLLGGLARDLEEQEIEPDLVIVTGDLLDRGSDAGVPMAVAFLSGLSARLGLRPGRFVLVPGNHDVSRATDPAERYASFDRIWREFYGSERPAMAEGTPPYHRVVRFDYGAELGIEVVGFNSCEALDAEARQEHGSIGAAQRDRADALLRPTRDQGLFRIAAMHHHLATPVGIVRNDYSVMDDAALILRFLAARRFQLALHGHQHVDWQEIREIDGFAVAIAAGGSAGVASYGRSAWMLQLGYQIIVLEGESVGRRLRREFDPQTRAWIAAGKGAGEQALRFGRVGGGRARPAARAVTMVFVGKLLFKVLRLPAQVDAFLTMQFAELLPYVTPTMSMAEKLTCLMQAVRDPQTIYDKLEEAYPDEVKRAAAELGHA